MTNIKELSPDEKHEIYNKGFEAGRKHTKPSETTIKMFNDMDKRLIHIEDDISSIKDKIKQVPTKTEMELSNEKLIDCVMDKQEKNIERLKEENDKKYASKERLSTIEKVVYGTIGAIVVPFIGFIGYLIYQAIIHFGE